MPTNPVYDTKSRMICQRFVGAGESFETNVVGPGDHPPHILIFYGKIVYTRLSGGSHETGFAIAVSPDTPAYSSYDGDGYSYYT